LAEEARIPKFSTLRFSTSRITLSPLILLAGFIFEIYAIMKKKK
jgi:hypothetical protein